MQVLRDDVRTYIIASKPWPTGSHLMIQSSGNGRKNPIVNGMVYAIDNASGHIAWKVPVTGHRLMLDQPHGLPLLVFASNVYDRTASERYSRVYCLDKRSGKVVCDERGTSSALSRVRLTADPATARLHIRSTNHTLTLSWKKQ